MIFPLETGSDHNPLDNYQDGQYTDQINRFDLEEIYTYRCN